MIRIKNGKSWFFAYGELHTTKVRDWYMDTYRGDSLGIEISDSVTFWDVFGLLNAGLGDKIYDVLWVGDSVVRERVFKRLSEIVGCEYDDVYETWLDEEVS